MNVRRSDTTPLSIRQVHTIIYGPRRGMACAWSVGPDRPLFYTSITHLRSAWYAQDGPDWYFTQMSHCWFSRDTFHIHMCDVCVQLISMRICVTECACARALVFTCIYVCVYVYVPVHVFVIMSSYLYICIYMYKYVHVWSVRIRTTLTFPPLVGTSSTWYHRVATAMF